MGVCVEHPEPVEPQVLVDLLDAARHVDHEAGVAPRGDHLRGPAYLAPHSLDEPIDQAGVPVDRAGLEVRRGVAADRLLRACQLDPGEAGGPVHERVHRRRDARGDGAPDELAARVHAVERGRRAESITISGGGPYFTVAANAST